MSRVDEQPGWVLHRRAWRESSLLVEFFSRDFGRIGLVARAARGARSPWRGLLEPFSPLTASWSRRGELATLIGLETDGSRFALSGRALWCGLYANELLIRLLARDDPMTEGFLGYARLLTELASGNDLGLALRRFELTLLETLGVLPELKLEAASGQPIEAVKRYHLDPEFGLIEAGPDEAGGVEGAALQALLAGDTVGSAQARQLRGLMRRLIDHQLGGRPLETRKLFEHRS